MQIDNEIIIRKLHGNLTSEEEVEFQNWLEASKTNQELFLAIQSLKGQGKGIDKIININVDEVWDNQIKKHKIRKFPSQLLKFAAVFLGIILASYAGYKLLHNVPETETLVVKNEQIILRLNDGTVKEISQAAEEISDQNGLKIASSKNGTLYIENEASKQISYNSLHVPYGKQINVVLPDGTNVFVNSGTTLKFPSSFTKNNPRIVEVEGEAFFSVTKKGESMPFIVKTTEIDVRVLGTEFMVCAYPDNQKKFVLLEEGSVAVHRSDIPFSASTLRIQPGERAQLENNTLRVEKVDVKKYTSWREGTLTFNNDDFGEVLKKIERHYNVSITNNYHKMKIGKLNGSFDDETILEVMDAFKKIAGFDYVIKNGNIQIEKPSRKNH